MPAPPDGSDAAKVRTMRRKCGIGVGGHGGAAPRRIAAPDARGGVATLAILLHPMSLPPIGRTRYPRLAMKKYMCLICGWIYDEAVGRPDDGIAPGTRWEDVPPNWTCPECGARKEDFEMVEF